MSVYVATGLMLDVVASVELPGGMVRLEGETDADFRTRIISGRRELLYNNLEWLKLSNKILRAFPSSPKQKALQEQRRALEARLLKV